MGFEVGVRARDVKSVYVKTKIRPLHVRRSPGVDSSAVASVWKLAS